MEGKATSDGDCVFRETDITIESKKESCRVKEIKSTKIISIYSGTTEEALLSNRNTCNIRMILESKDEYCKYRNIK